MADALVLCLWQPDGWRRRCRRRCRLLLFFFFFTFCCFGVWNSAGFSFFFLFFILKEEEEEEGSVESVVIDTLHGVVATIQLSSGNSRLVFEWPPPPPPEPETKTPFFFFPFFFLNDKLQSAEFPRVGLHRLARRGAAPTESIPHAAEKDVVVTGRLVASWSRHRSVATGLISMLQ